VASVSKEYSL
jgi:hypothetical protein